MTAVPRAVEGLLTGLPESVAALRRVVPEVLVHGDLVKLYGLSPGPDDLSEMEVRPAGSLLEILQSRSDRPLVAGRPPEERVRSSCRDFAVLLCALLRRRSVPSRVRCGFAGYFEPGRWGDHWILEWWNAGDRRWQRVDAEVDAEVRQAFGLTLDPDDLPAGAFLAGAEAWHACRNGEFDPQLFGYLDSLGLRMIAGSVIRDLAALNREEMLPWDYWGAMDDWDLGRAQVEVGVIDDLAAAVLSEDVDRIRTAYRRPGISVPALTLVRPDR